MNNYLKQDLISRITKCLKEENERNSFETDWESLNIPFMIAPLVQLLESDQLNNIEEHLKEWSIFDFYYNSDKTERCNYGSVRLVTYKKNHSTSSELSNIIYIFEFYRDDRSYGYCECNQDDEDYREDKHCCGHSCDWDAPGVVVKKVINIINHPWAGDEHDFWEFEDDFHKTHEDLRAEKLAKERATRMEYLKNSIHEMQNELRSLQ